MLRVGWASAASDCSGRLAEAFAAARRLSCCIAVPNLEAGLGGAFSVRYSGGPLGCDRTAAGGAFVCLAFSRAAFLAFRSSSLCCLSASSLRCSSCLRSSSWARLRSSSRLRWASRSSYAMLVSVSPDIAGQITKLTCSFRLAAMPRAFGRPGPDEVTDPAKLCIDDLDCSIW